MEKFSKTLVTYEFVFPYRVKCYPKKLVVGNSACFQ